ncbi:MAG TPA: hypothetical protein VK559_11340 [Ferruginibacter sp.]|nr:hypothetical protein [Ferruginibacter sp.]
MRLLLLLACLATIPTKGLPEKMAPYREIQHIEVDFTTTSGCKPDDTGLDIQFKAASNNMIASKSGQFGKFDKNTTNEVDLDVQGEYSDKDLPNSIINLHVIPTNAVNNWNFDIDVTIIWNNGNHTIVHSSGYSLAQNGNDIQVDAF